MIEMPAMIETDQSEVEQTEGHMISTMVVLCSKHRLEMGGWLRRARLMARQFRNSIELEQTFCTNIHEGDPQGVDPLPTQREWGICGSHIKHQICLLHGVSTSLSSNYPGASQPPRSASQWFQLFAPTCKE